MCNPWPNPANWSVGHGLQPVGETFLTHRLKPPANDNQSPAGRRICNELPADMPIFETELALVENCFGEIIGKLFESVANGPDAAADKGSKP